jgi:hypothetical protein
MKWLFRKRAPKLETTREKVERIRKALILNLETGNYEITREYKDAVIDEIMEHLEDDQNVSA